MAPRQDVPALAAAESAAGSALVLGRYRLGRRLGSGGFGTVFAAHDERLGRPVAVKVIPAGGDAPERGRREALTVARLDHPAIVGVLDVGEAPDARYLVSELVEGRTLAQLEAEGELSDRDVLRVGLALAGALEHAHDRGVVHRDLKPQNVMVPDRPRSALGAAKLTDFGVARLAGDESLTQTGDVVGTLAYMAPEQAAGRRVDERADLYALGLVLYEALAGSNPVRAAGAAATARRVGVAIAPLQRARRDLPEKLCLAIDRVVRPHPAERGELGDLRSALAIALPRVGDEGGTIAPHPLERAPAAAAAAARCAAATAAGALVAAALIGLEPAGGPPPAAAAAAAAGLTAVLPRVGWLLSAAAVLAVLLSAPEPATGAAVLLTTAAAIPPLLAWRSGRWWSLPAAAPLLGLIGLAGAYPALAGFPPRAGARAAMGIAGLCWLVLAESLLGRTLLFGGLAGGGGRIGRDSTAEAAATEALGPLASSGVLAQAGVWALAAVVLPWLVRGRSLAVDVVGATFWAAGLIAATGSVGAWLGDAVTRPQPPGLVAGGIVGGLLALALRWGRGGGDHRDRPRRQPPYLPHVE